MKPTSAASAGLGLAFAVVAAVLAWRSRGWPLVHDAPIMHYLAWRIGDGAVPYRDLFDMNFPGAYLAHLAVLRWLGPGDAAWRAFDLLWLGAGAIAIAAFAARWGAAVAFGGAMLFAAYHLAGGAWQAGQRDFVLCPLLVLGALGVARWAEGAPAASVVGGGLALGAAATVKPHALGLAGALAIVMAAVGWRACRRIPGAPLAAFLAAVAAPPLAVGAWLAGRGALGAWRDIVVDYLLPLYSRLGRPVEWTFWRWQVWIVIAAAVVVSLARAVASGRFTRRRAIATVGLAYGLVHFVGQGKGWEYHLHPLAAFCAVLAFSGFDPAVDKGRARRGPGALLQPAAAVALAVSLSVAVGMLWAKGAEASWPAWIEAKERRVAALTATLASRTGPGDLVQVLDTTEGGVHALLRLRLAQPTRFVYDFHFYHDADSPTVRRLRAELIRDLDARPPRAVVLFERGWPGGGYERIERFPELRDRLAARYALAAGGDGWRLYAKRNDP